MTALTIRRAAARVTNKRSRIVAGICAAIALVVGLTVFQVPFRGSPAILAISICLFLFGALFWGVFVSASARTQLQAYQMGVLSSFLPAFMLSGFVYSIETMPKVIQVVTLIVPAGRWPRSVACR